MKPNEMYKIKKKRAIDPNAPPRPTLLGHEKVLKDTRIATELRDQEIRFLKQRIDDLERKLNSQTAYLNALHQTITAKRS